MFKYRQYVKIIFQRIAKVLVNYLNTEFSVCVRHAGMAGAEHKVIKSHVNSINNHYQHIYQILFHIPSSYPIQYISCRCDISRRNCRCRSLIMLMNRGPLIEAITHSSPWCSIKSNMASSVASLVASPWRVCL